MADEEVEEEVETEEEAEEESGNLPRSQTYKHEAQVQWLWDEKGIDCDELTPAQIISVAYATRVEWRKSDTYRELVEEYNRNKAEEDAAKAEKVAEAKAAREAAKREKDERKAKEAAENKEKVKDAVEKKSAAKATRSGRPAKKAATKASAARKRGKASEESEEDPFE